MSLLMSLVDSNLITIDPYQALVDLILIIFSIYVIFKRPQKPEKAFTEAEIQELIDEWEPEPLITSLTPLMVLDQQVPLITSSPDPTHVVIDGKQVFNLARFNFLGFVSNPQINAVSTESVYKYGVGTCGPRQFYGTIDTHIHLESRIKQFLGTQDCMIYSYGVATSSSSIPAFAGREDLLIVDKGISIAMQVGVTLSRSEIIWYDHNDMADLERVLQKVERETQSKKRKLTRRFIVFESIAFNYGDIAPLKKIVELKHQYKYRIMMEDLSIGNLGKTGRGICEHFNIPTTEIEILTGNLEHICGSVGGFCAADKKIIFHQRLNSSGYVYSASLPPLLAAHAQKALDIIDEQPKLLADFRDRIELVYEGLSQIPQVKIRGSILAPVIHLELSQPRDDRYENEIILQHVVDAALENGVLLTRSKYSSDEKFMPAPSIRVCVCAVADKNELKNAVEVIKRAFKLATSGLALSKAASAAPPGKDMKKSRSAVQL